MTCKWGRAQSLPFLTLKTPWEAPPACVEQRRPDFQKSKPEQNKWNIKQATTKPLTFSLQPEQSFKRHCFLIIKILKTEDLSPDCATWLSTTLKDRCWYPGTYPFCIVFHIHHFYKSKFEWSKTKIILRIKEVKAAILSEWGLDTALSGRPLQCFGRILTPWDQYSRNYPSGPLRKDGGHTPGSVRRTLSHGGNITTSTHSLSSINWCLFRFLSEMFQFLRGH